MAILHVNESEFDREVLQDSGTVLVDFWATWYGIESIPTLLVFKGGQMADRSVGLVSPQEILDLVK